MRISGWRKISSPAANSALPAIVAQPENEDFIKRVIGLPGETLEIHDQTVYIDGTPLAEPYLTDAARRANGDFGPIQVPAGKLFVMGSPPERSPPDARPRRKDSIPDRSDHP